MTETPLPRVGATSSAATGGSGDPRHRGRARVDDAARSVRSFGALGVKRVTDTMEVAWICPQAMAA